MGFFDKFKKSFSGAVDSVKESVNKTGEAFKFNRLKEGLNKTKNSFAKNILSVLGSGRKIDAELIQDIEDILITSDIGVNTTDLIIDRLKERVKEEKYESSDDVYRILKEEIFKILSSSESGKKENNFIVEEDSKPYTVMMIGVNGAGKTTTIAKLAHNYKDNGNSVIIGAADTFRAAANEQLAVWAQRADVPLIQQQQGADPGSVVFETMDQAKRSNTDVVLIDTAGRLHNKLNLMKELEKLSRVISKHKDNGPDEVLLVLDATTGQNAIQQAKEFQKVANITGLVLTKLDGSAKGGVVLAIANEMNLPVKYIGVGEQMYDLQIFDPLNFVEALFGSETGEETVLAE